MNSFGTLFRVSVWGESHGPAVGVVIDGCPAGLPLAIEDFLTDLERRQGGKTRGTTPRSEPDVPRFLSGVLDGRATGSPLVIIFENTNVRSADYDSLKQTPRPGHADLVALQKFGGFADSRGGGHFSGRLTASIVAAGVIAKQLIRPLEINAQLIEVGGSQDIKKVIDETLAAGDSVGGIVECALSHVPIGLGEPFFDSVESLIAHAVFAIPAVKGIEFGAGFAAGRARGSEFHDEILDRSGRTATNNAGGINGGITNGNDLYFRIAVKPTSSIRAPKQTVNLQTGDPVTLSVEGRHDACIALRVPVVVEAVTAIVIADLMLREQKIPRIWS